MFGFFKKKFTEQDRAVLKPFTDLYQKMHDDVMRMPEDDVFDLADACRHASHVNCTESEYKAAQLVLSIIHRYWNGERIF